MLRFNPAQSYYQNAIKGGGGTYEQQTATKALPGMRLEALNSGSQPS